MRQRVILSLITFFFFILVFFFQKIIFILVHGGISGGVSITDSLSILYHGLSLDMSIGGYLAVIPMLLLIASVQLPVRTLIKIFDAYFVTILIVIAVITIVDVGLYSYWGFHLDSTVLFYILNPKEVIASASGMEWFLRTLSTVVYAVFLYLCYAFTVRKLILKLTVSRNFVMTYLVMILLTGALFLPIRGSVTVSTMNVSFAYFSDRMFLNHAAINPVFNLMYSLSKHDDFASQYQFYDKDEALHIFSRLSEQPQCDSIPQLLHTDRPNIILFMLESFSYDVALDSVVAPNMYGFAREGVLFENFYANSFRTDRGIVSIMSGYPSHPTEAILKHPKKTESLPSISKSLRLAGYENQSMYYGGDIKFANMRSYFVGACGITDIVADSDFPVRERLTKWGVPDKPLFDRVYRDIMGGGKASDNEGVVVAPFLKVILTLSSHEPFDVPVDTFEEPFLNSVNYTDKCIGDFVSGLRESDLWDNTLIVFLADHAMQGYPQGVDNYKELRFKIPMVWIGGALNQSRIISDYGSQNDLAATLLSQLGVDYSNFKFSKDMLNPSGRKFSFYSYVNGFCMRDSSNIFLYDNDRQNTLEQAGDIAMEKDAKSFFQMMYIDLGSR